MIMAHELTQALARLGTCALLGFTAACGSEAPVAPSANGTPSAALTPGQLTAPDHPATQGSAPEAEGAVGSIALSLKLGDKQLDSMNYAIVGSGFSTSGSLDVSHSSKVTGVIGGIPFGTNYALTMNGHGVGSAPLACSGSASFDLKDVGPLPVNIQITCKEPAVVEPPTAPTPAPVPPLAVFALACALGALGIAAQRRAARG
jgi:hypothetical protein